MKHRIWNIDIWEIEQLEHSTSNLRLWNIGTQNIGTYDTTTSNMKTFEHQNFCHR